MPNEAISIPSNQRYKWIHKRIFERTVGELDFEKTYMTMDCRKWAPNSNLLKYVYFVLGLSKSLPPEMVIHFLNFFDAMFDKRFCVRKDVYNNFVKNESNKDYDYLIEDGNNYYMNMPYSFMMGVFNGLSSLLHAG